MIGKNQAQYTQEEGMSNSRLSGDTKVIKCAFCGTLESLKTFNGSYICEECIAYMKQITSNS